MKTTVRNNEAKTAGLKRRAIVILLALTLVFQYSSFGLNSAWAAETETEEIIQTEEIAVEASQDEVKEEAPVEEAKTEEVKEEAPAVQEAPAEEAKAEEAKEEAPAVQEAPKAIEVKAEAPKVETKTSAPLKATASKTASTAATTATKAPTLTIKYHFYQMSADGSYTEAKVLSRTVKEGASTTSITLTTANGYVTNKNLEVNGKSLRYINAWSYANGSAVSFPLTRSYAEAQELVGDGTTADIAVYAEYRASAKLTLHYDDIRKTNGTITSSQNVNTLSWGSSSSVGLKKLESASGLRAGQVFTSNGKKFKYTGVWNCSLGGVVDANTSLTFKVGDAANNGSTYFFTEDLGVYFTPIYEEEVVNGFKLSYIDRISTGSGSWSNQGADGVFSEFSTTTHTFKAPEGRTHYQFINWLDPETEITYGAGDKYTFNYKDLAAGEFREVKIFAIWQPSVTVNYVVLGHTANQEESFESVNVYGYTPEAKDANTQFEGWYDEDGNRIDENTVYAAPEATGIEENVIKPEVINVYARFNTTHTVTKIWDDQDREDSLRAEEIEAELIANGEDTDAIAVLSEENDWTFTFEDLDAYKNNKLINYTSDEITEFGTEYDKLVETADGTTTITNVFRPTITLTAASDSWMYDGEDHQNTAVEITEGSLYEGDRLEASADGIAKNVNDTEEGNNQVAEFAIMRGDEDVTDKYNIETVAGTLEITQRTVILTSSDETKNYDEEALTGGSVEVTGDGFAAEEGAEYNFTGTITEVGNTENTFEYVLNENTDAANYNIETVYGTLTVEEAPVIEPEEIEEPEETPEEEPKAEEPQQEVKEEEPAANDEPEAVIVNEEPQQEEPKAEAEVIVDDADDEVAEEIDNEAAEEIDNEAAEDEDDNEVIIPSQTPVRPQQVGPNAANIVNETPEVPMNEIAEIEAEDTPQTVNAAVTEEATEEIEMIDSEAPKAGFMGSWALINLIETIATALVTLLLMAFWFIKRRNEEAPQGAEFQAAEGGMEEESYKWNRKGMMRLLSIIPAIVAIILFILTEDMSQPMVMADRWTLVMTAILLVNAGIALLSKKTKEEADEQ